MNALPAQFDLLKNAFLQNRLSHAYLLSGIAGIGKTDFAKQFSQLLLCDHHNHCGICRGCKQLQAGTHPDFIFIAPEEKNHSIKIDQIRLLSEKLSQTAQYGGYQVVIISPSDAMPAQAANALLKTLEEPAGKVLFFLIDHQKSILPATIASRCQKLLFAPNHEKLKLYDGELTLRDQLLSHLENIILRRQNSISFPPTFLKIPLYDLVRLLLLLCIDMSRIQLSVSQKYSVNADVFDRLKKIADCISLHSMQKVITLLLEKQSFIAQGINLNVQLCLEDVFIECSVTR